MKQIKVVCKSCLRTYCCFGNIIQLCPRNRNECKYICPTDVLIQKCAKCIRETKNVRKKM